MGGRRALGGMWSGDGGRGLFLGESGSSFAIWEDALCGCCGGFLKEGDFGGGVGGIGERLGTKEVALDTDIVIRRQPPPVEVLMVFMVLVVRVGKKAG